MTQSTLTPLPTTDKLPLPNGLILYDGPSELDGSTIVAIATNLRRRSENAKTGNMVQTWILAKHQHPYAAIHDGNDAAICGDCPLRGIIDARGGETRNRQRACYVDVSKAPSQVWRAYQAGSYAEFRHAHLRQFHGRMVRLGAYGDPCAVPYSVWKPLTRMAKGHTGYTHQWRVPRFWRYRHLVMASVETIDDAALARSRGWRTFRSSLDGDPSAGEFSCPASAEEGHRLTCEQCGACNGTNGNPTRASVHIIAHGGPAVLGNFRRTIAHG